jgi:lipid-binding SYLF domain-containing protein
VGFISISKGEFMNNISIDEAKIELAIKLNDALYKKNHIPKEIYEKIDSSLHQKLTKHHRLHIINE